MTRSGDDKIQPISSVETQTFILERLWRLAADFQAMLRQLVRQAGFVYGLQKARAQRLVNFKARVDDLSRDGVRGR